MPANIINEDCYSCFSFHHNHLLISGKVHYYYSIEQSKKNHEYNEEKKSLKVEPKWPGIKVNDKRSFGYWEQQ